MGVQLLAHQGRRVRDLVEGDAAVPVDEDAHESASAGR
jgi:hypothetical protein